MSATALTSAAARNREANLNAIIVFRQRVQSLALLL
jgi:hypothetical protein